MQPPPKHAIQTATPREAPNLNWLRVFVVAAQAESFVVAADELGVTPGAVSQRIKALEAQVGAELFVRHARGVALTEAGRRLSNRVAPLLADILRATRDVDPSFDGRRLRLTILPAIAQLWLGPRIEEFRRSFPGVAVDIDADAAIIDLREGEFDLAIRYGRPPFDHCQHRQILVDELVPVASPVMALSPRDAHGLPRDAALLADTYWMNDFDLWRRLCAPDCITQPTVQTYSLYAMVVDAAVKGHGYMIGHTALIGDHLRDGSLVALSQARCPNSKQFYVLGRRDLGPSDVVDRFVTWLFEQADASSAPAPNLRFPSGASPSS